MSPPDPAQDRSFEASRPRLVRLAYRMLGSVAEAEDVVQDAFIRWHRRDRGGIRDPEAYLMRIVARLCLDVLKSARARREIYIGPWLPEPVVESPEDEADDITLTLMLALERLSPLERAAFLLHDVFGQSFDEVSRSIGRTAIACRRLADRARDHVREARPRFPVAEEQGRRIAAAFLAAARSGDVEALQLILAEDVVFQSDGGGVRPAALNPIRSRDKVVRLLAALARKRGGASPPVLEEGLINGLPGFVTLEADGLPQATVLAIDGGRIAAIYVIRNPEKLLRLTPFPVPGAPPAG
ncbi:sigma-70 family RNA polymerase sigma factor [Labrys monachus]|uniref:RNA polymerase sigma-70 factor (ECF subfamily) n=1 Tax=Labrys monachus TaxID=217067 RepID=A0ABU0FCP9_9HYPH|nr:sigma-70 family RNA polymerase sigma factor [Labrys monachus]MDQ0392393.1 RNA polymerase sigma-70 factor (ECF subfamily) [Labrys monachus]